MTFDASNSSDSGATITQYVWDFGDGGQSTSTPSPSIQHSYSSGGTYTVTLTVVDSAGATAQSTQPISVTGRATAAFNPTQATVLTGSPLGFDGTQSSDPDGSITGYSWNFGDGSTSTSSQPSHTYSTPGTYNVTLTVTDNSGNTSAVTHQITVIAPPPIQTLIESLVPPPIVVKYGPPAVVGRALVDLRERLFCPGTGPVCQTTITETKTGLARDRQAGRALAVAAASAVLTTPANGNAELGLRLTTAQWKALVKKHRLAVVLVIASVRGGEKVTTTLGLTLRHKR